MEQRIQVQEFGVHSEGLTWWIIPLSKWVISPVINGISRINPLVTRVIAYLLSGMIHQVENASGFSTKAPAAQALKSTRPRNWVSSTFRAGSASSLGRNVDSLGHFDVMGFPPWGPEHRTLENTSLW